MEGTNNARPTPDGQSPDMPQVPGSTPGIPPAPGTIPRATINIREALEANNAEHPQTASTVRTFQTDVAHSVKNDNVSMIKIALAEKARQEQGVGYADLSRPGRKHGGLIVILVVLLLIGGSVTAWYFYVNKPLPPTISERIAPNEPELLYSEEQAMVSSFDKSSDQIVRELRAEMLADSDLGVIKRTLLSAGTATSTRNTTTAEFLTLIRSRASDNLKSAFGSQYFLGGYSNKPHDSFILIKVNSYESAYPGMLQWEPYMDSDLGRFFPSSLIATSTGSGTTPSSISSSTAQVTGTSTAIVSGEKSGETMTGANAASNGTSSVDSSGAAIPSVRTVNQASATFEDRIIQNKDTRALIGLDGNIKFLYTFLDQKTLLIVSSERGLKEVQARLTTGRIRR